MSQIGKGLAILFVIGLALFSLFELIPKSTTPPPANGIAYSQFLQYAERGQIRSVLLRGDNISAQLIDGRTVSSYAANDPGFVRRLVDKGVVVTAEPAADAAPSWSRILIPWFPMLLLIGGVFYMSRMRASGSDATRRRIDDLQARVLALEAGVARSGSAGQPRTESR
jgi:cell division protease FtsH